MTTQSFIASLALAWAVSSASALTLTLCDTVPTPGPADAFNFSGAVNDGANVSDGRVYPEGPGNDQFTYVAGDRPHQGQTFTTGSHPKGYIIKAVWVRQAGYTENAVRTTWQMNAGGKITLRVTDPMLGGSDKFALHAEDYIATGKEGWGGPMRSSINGAGTWLKFTFSSPVVLSPDKTYGFDLCSSHRQVYFEWLGISDSDAYIGGGAYNGNTAGAPDNAMNGLAGDRVFLVELAECQ